MADRQPVPSFKNALPRGAAHGNTEPTPRFAAAALYI
jgi:hypothetical protein